MEMQNNISEITRACPTQPCYMASVQVTVPTTETAGEEVEAYIYTVFINSNRYTTVSHDTATKTPCL